MGAPPPYLKVLNKIADALDRIANALERKESRCLAVKKTIRWDDLSPLIREEFIRIQEKIEGIEAVKKPSVPVIRIQPKGCDNHAATRNGRDNISSDDQG